MGFHMAGHIRKKMDPASTLFINDISLASCKRFVELFSQFGPVEVTETARDLANQSKVILSIVPQGANVRAVYLEGSGAIIKANKGDRLILECSTIDMNTTRDVGRQITDAGIGTYVDTPVSGGVVGAQSGALAFLVGHKDNSVDPVTRKILEIVTMMGPPAKVSFCGNLGNGLAAKITNNYIACSVLLATAEAMAVGIRAGVDKKVLYDCIRNSTGQSWVLENMLPVPGIVPHAPSSNGYHPTFRPHMIIKDISLAIEAAEQTGIEATVAKTALEVFKKSAEDPRCVDRDCTSVWLMIMDEEEEGSGN
ncbi:uncharacterized protein Z519_12295 [Cladophialophora bantiana CBS 173.52]|uniref:3-hydroxyisobutyrate dehydrogenase n=1 Tax=Cladophialophora bantiana (strain ATCC 10958 / CBS 173.52 / CDC B-1940 / NIH 8579) TaxID=1442370 RepID=A0A0D2HS32_CLAB1|nr:uncharacterized protein Z519_12295 [Cladophialophora bantiana CBS 173.52]KIW87184.1 hypothetical protein Z519_12295 [Cladophialophora bantiana CBS 173.52]